MQDVGAASAQGGIAYAEGDSTQNLVMACNIGDAAAAKRFLDEGASPDGTSSASAIYCASWHGHLEIVRLLADRGANVNYATWARAR